MKKVLLLLVLGLLTALTTQAQQVPQGMKYQAVARSLTGDVMANQPVTLRISLVSKRGAANAAHYTETHTVTTNALGLFDLTIGNGKAAGTGTFRSVPWSSEDIWMEIAIQDGMSSGFSTISNSRLLAVPYAFHAMTANQLVGNSAARAAAGGPTDGVPSNVWSTFGNTRTDPSTDRMGTMDYVDLIFVTNKLERLRITKDGDINIANSLKVGKNVEVGQDLTVKRNVYLNTTGGATVNNGPLTVANMSATKLTGTLDVDKATNLNSTLNVVGASTLRNTLQVDQNATFKQNVTLDNAGLGSTSPTSGALVVAGGVGIGQNLNVAGSTTLGGVLSITSDLESTATTNGALVVTGGVGIGKRLNVGGATNLNSALTVNNMSATKLTGTLEVDKATTLKSTLAVDGATDLNSSLNVDGATTLNSTVNAFGQMTIRKNLGTDENNYDNYPLRVEGSSQGIAVKLSSSAPLPGNNFITFFNSGGTAEGRIEGSATIGDGLRAAVISIVGTPDFDTAFSTGDDKNQPVDQTIPGPAANFFTSNYAYGAYSQTLDLVGDIVRLITNVIGASGLCLSGDCDDVIWSAVDVAVGALQLGGYIAFNEIQRGVAFESGGADYAEWLLKADAKEKLVFGEVVGVKGGVVSKSFVDAEKYMIVSRAPAVIGGMPDPKKVAMYEKIAFMGQVPVKVLGRTRKGDYILPSGKSDGMAMAVAPTNMSALDYRRVIGIAWADSDPKKAFSYINTAVGINTNDLAVTVDQMQTVINDMQLALQKAVPDYKPTPFAVSGRGMVASNGTGTQPAYSTTPSMREVIKNDIAKGGYTNLREAMQEVKQYVGAQGVDLSQYPYMNELLDNPTPEVAKKAQAHYAKVLVNAQNLLARQQKAANSR